MTLVRAVCAFDDAFAQHAGVMLSSFFDSSAVGTTIEATVIDGGISDTNIERLTSLSRGTRHRIRFVKPELAAVEGLRVDGHASVATYLRLLIPDLLPDVDRVLYLDCDMVITRDLSELWEVEVGDHALAAVEDLLGDSRLADLGIPAGSGYFNSGVLLMNLEKWREQNIGQKVLNLVRRNPEALEWWDQDALNALLHNDWIPLHPKWNHQAHWLLHGVPGLARGDVREATGNPAIIHFTTASKPWHYTNEHPRKRAYRRALKRSPWRGAPPEGRTLKAVLKKNRRKFRKWIRRGISQLVRESPTGRTPSA